MEHARFDTRGYRTVGVGEGYGEWVEHYDRTVCDEMDLRLLGRLELEWAAFDRAADLACGTGRIGQWLASRGVGRVDGVDLTEAMLDRARGRAVYETTAIGDMRQTPLESGVYDLAIEVLADEHIPDLAPLYAETARLLGPSGRFVIVGYHPHFLMGGTPTHFHRAESDEPIAIESWVHQISDHVHAARSAGLGLEAMEEGLVDDEWLAAKPKWERHRWHPVSFAMVWRPR